MVQITNTTQLSVFSLVRAAIVADTTLKTKFSSKNIHQYEPKHKSGSFTGFPYIWINVPESDTTKLVFDNNFTLKDFTEDVYLRMEYMARDNYVSYCNAIIKAVEAYESTFQAAGYYDIKIDLISTDSNQVINSKEIIEGIFEIKWHGQVTR